MMSLEHLNTNHSQTKLNLSTFKDCLTSAAIMLADIAECFREIEIIFFAIKDQQPAYLAQVCEEFLNHKKISMPSKLPNYHDRIQVNFNQKKSQWEEIRTQEKIDIREFKKRLDLVTAKFAYYFKNNPDFLNAYLIRQQKYYQAEHKPDIEINLTKPTSLSKDVGLLRTELTEQFKRYKQLLCLSPEDTTTAICKTLSTETALTIDSCQQIILIIFVGRDISYQDTNHHLTLSPQINSYLTSLAITCFNLCNEISRVPRQNLFTTSKSENTSLQVIDEKSQTYDLRTGATQEQWQKSASALLISNSTLFKQEKTKPSVTIEVSDDEYKLLQEIRKKSQDPIASPPQSSPQILSEQSMLTEDIEYHV